MRREKPAMKSVISDKTWYSLRRIAEVHRRICHMMDDVHIWWMTYTAQQQCRRHSWNRRKAAFDNRCEKIAAKTVKIKIVWNFWNCLNFFEKRCWQKRKTMVWYNTLKAMSRKQSGKIEWQQKNVEKSKKNTWQTEIKVVKYISCQTKKEKCI